MNRQNTVLFNKITFFDYCDRVNSSVRERVASYDHNALLNTPTDDLIEYFTKLLSLGPIALSHEDQWHIDGPREVSVDVEDAYRSSWTGRDHISVPGTAVTLVMPIEGEAELLHIRPSQSWSDPPRVQLERQQISIEVVGRDLDQATVKRTIDQIVDSLKRHLQALQRDISGFNQNLPLTLKPMIEQRKAKLLSARNMVGSLGYRLKERADTTRTFAAPQVVRKIVPAPPIASSAPFKPEPGLNDDNYRHILSVISGMSLVLERSPNAFRTMGEEDLRQHFLVQLNGHYEGSASGETFNFQGKTDILVRVEDRNIFIGECKFWSGEKGFIETIDQVLSYLGWRDTKAAVIMFNKNKNFSEMISKMKDAASKHPNRKSGPIEESETRFRYKFKSKIDETRELTLTILAFDVPN